MPMRGWSPLMGKRMLTKGTASAVPYLLWRSTALAAEVRFFETHSSEVCRDRIASSSLCLMH